MPEKTEERARETTAEGGKAALFFLARPSLSSPQPSLGFRARSFVGTRAPNT